MFAVAPIPAALQYLEVLSFCVSTPLQLTMSHRANICGAFADTASDRSALRIQVRLYPADRTGPLVTERPFFAGPPSAAQEGPAAILRLSEARIESRL
jgi:hypothetical protein